MGSTRSSRKREGLGEGVFMPLSKKDIARRKANMRVELEKLEEKARKNPLNRALQEEAAALRKKLEEDG